MHQDRLVRPGQVQARFGPRGFVLDRRVNVAVDKVGDRLDGPRHAEVGDGFLFRYFEMLVTPSLSWMPCRVMGR